MARGDRTCAVCGKKYNFCGSCSKDVRSKETWRNLYCSANCRNIFNILSEFAFNHISAIDAKKRLNGTNLSKKGEFREDLRKQVDTILATKEEVPASKQVETKQNEKKNEIVKDDFKK